MPKVRRDPFDPLSQDLTHSRRTVLSCGHVQFKMAPLHEFGAVIKCAPCNGKDSTVTEIDMRDLEVYCPTHGSVAKLHPNANVTAGVIKMRHNITDNKGKCNAETRITGEVITTADMWAALRNAEREDGSLF